MNNDIRDLGINLLGGVLVAFLDRVIIFLNNKFIGYRYKQIFGNDTIEFNIVYGKMVLKPRYSNSDRYPYLKPNTGGEFRISSPVSFAETRAAKYLSESFSKALKKSPRLISDDEIWERIDISYCSLGGYNNLKTIQIIESTQNEFLELNLNQPCSIINKRCRHIFYSTDNIHDYALIIKIKNKLFPNRTQICVAGLAEWGTSGGSWFLANKWQELRKKVGYRNFGAVIRVRVGADESAELIEVIQ